LKKIFNVRTKALINLRHIIDEPHEKMTYSSLERKTTRSDSPLKNKKNVSISHFLPTNINIDCSRHIRNTDE